MEYLDNTEDLLLVLSGVIMVCILKKNVEELGVNCLDVCNFK